jgi:type 1 glutamine amidotransferase
MLRTLAPAALLIAATHFVAPADAQTATPLKPEEFVQIFNAAPATAPATPQRPRRLLIYTDCRGFVHSSIPHCTAAIQALGWRTGAFDSDVSADPEVFRPASLARYDAICFNNTTGTLFDDPALRESLLDFVRAGGGIVGIHAATDCFYEWPAFGELMGGYFDGHPWNEEVTLHVENADHPLTQMFGEAPFAVADEIYQFRAPYSRDKLRVLLTLDTKQTDMNKSGIKRDDNDFAVSWIHPYGAGRVFYCSLGHRHDIFTNTTILEHYLAGIQYALGDLPADATP